jgi:hypothetical protein
MRVVRWRVAITIDDRFVIAVAMCLVTVLGIVLVLLKK